jgi:pilus assembly protein CpaD
MKATDTTMPHSRQTRIPGRFGLKRWARAAALLAAAPLSACNSGGVDRITTASIQDQDVRARHPIELANSRATLDVIPQLRGGALDERSRGQISQFARDYGQDGSGDISLAVPRGGPGAAQARAAVPAIRQALVAGGARGYVLVSSYPIADPTVAAPVRLSYAAVVARTRTRCGQWPSDLASGSSTETWDNRPYWNFGCASQQMLAAQIADPRDLLEPSAVAPPDGQMRARAIKSVRQGQDPGTSWTIQNSNIGGVGN